MQSPSSAVKPRLLSTLLPFCEGAQAGPASQVGDDHAPLARSPAPPRAAPRRCTRTTARGSRSAARPSRGSRAGRGTSSATAGWPRWKLVSKQATCGTPGRRSNTASMAARLCGWWRGASGTSFRSSSRTSGVTTVGTGEPRPRRGRRGGRRRARARRRSASGASAARASSAPRAVAHRRRPASGRPASRPRRPWRTGAASSRSPRSGPGLPGARPRPPAAGTRRTSGSKSRR